MRTLRLVALSDDGQTLILTTDGADSDGGERFEVPIDDRLRAAARGDSRRLTQIDVDLGTELPPRVIQARIRAGETPEQVAAASGTRVERIMRFAHPVLQERERVAEQAREARVRLSEGTPSVPLQQYMSERLRLLGADLDAVRWDAHRADDGVWQVTAAWQAGAKSGVTRWAYDIPARTVTPVDAATTDFAEGTRLVRVVPHVPTERPAPMRSRPVVVVPDDDDVAAPASSRLARDEDDEPAADDDVRPVLPADGAPAGTRRTDPPADADDISEHDTFVLGRPGGEGDDDEDPRARIPAWEDIVFGVRRQR
jgi:hypothetical protein